MSSLIYNRQQNYQMDMKQEKGAAYLPNKVIKPKKPLDILNKQTNNSLPSINGVFKEQKINEIRGQIEDSRNEISVLKARINSLKWEKEKFDKRKQKHQHEINFINTVRDRVSQDKKYKQQLQQKKEKDLETLRQQVSSMRQQIIKERRMAKTLLSEKKTIEALQGKTKRKEQQEFIRKTREQELSDNQNKARGIKQSRLEIEQKLKSFNRSRIIFAQQNHHDRVQRSLSQKQKMERILRKLRKEEQKLLEDCKKSEADMMSSLYELETLNPEKKRRESITSEKVAFKFI